MSNTVKSDRAGEPEERLYYIVVNDEEQYSILPVEHRVPVGWNPVGEPLGKSAALDEIARVWVDIRPKSVRVQS